MGPWTIAAIAAGLVGNTDSGKVAIRRLFKAGIKAGLRIKDECIELAEEAKNFKDEITAEAKSKQLNEALESQKRPSSADPAQTAEFEL